MNIKPKYYKDLKTFAIRQYRYVKRLEKNTEEGHPMPSTEEANILNAVFGLSYHIYHTLKNNEKKSIKKAKK